MGQLVTVEEACKKCCKHQDSTEIIKCFANLCMSWDWWDEENLCELRRGYCSLDRVRPNKIGNEKKQTMGYG